MKSFEYDATGKMIKGTNSDSETSIYTYNGLDVLVNNTWNVKGMLMDMLQVSIRQV